MRALLLHHDPDQLLPFLTDRCEGLQWDAADRPAAVAPALARHDPELVFSIKHSGFPGAAHRQALVHPSVRWFQVGGSGIEHLGRWDAGRVRVTTAAGVLAPWLAEMAVAAMSAMAVGLPVYQAQQAARLWRPRTFRPLAGRTLLVVGVGHTGGALAEKARALGLRVVGIRASGRPHPAVEVMHPPEALLALLPEADIVSLHVRLGPSTHHLLDRAAFARMKPGALLLNAARGAVVDTSALLQALDHLGGAWLDVFEEEPLPSDHPLWRHPKVLITPHSADQVEDWPLRLAERFVENWARWRSGQPLVDEVAPPA